MRGKVTLCTDYEQNSHLITEILQIPKCNSGNAVGKGLNLPGISPINCTFTVTRELPKSRSCLERGLMKKRELTPSILDYGSVSLSAPNRIWWTAIAVTLSLSPKTLREILLSSILVIYCNR